MNQIRDKLLWNTSTPSLALAFLCQWCPVEQWPLGRTEYTKDIKSCTPNWFSLHQGDSEKDRIFYNFFLHLYINIHKKKCICKSKINDRSKLHNLNKTTVMNLFQTTWTHHMSLSFISYIGKWTHWGSANSKRKHLIKVR